MSNKYDEIMQRLGACLWTRSGQPSPLSSSELNKMEATLGYALPEDFREFWHHYGGYGISGHAVFPLRDNLDGRTEGSIEEFVTFHPNSGKREDYYGGMHDTWWELETCPGFRLVRDYEEDVEDVEWPRELLPFGWNAGSGMPALALGGLRPGAIFYWAPTIGLQAAYLVADSFDEFMNLLRR